ncbi:transposase InsO family protein [Geothermobacter ehrlichii]|uniref:Transposase InsO family protein n=1 Tax=Geothermobacter ehrlichii TaxID=213224 RepID=A0A5D3WHX4_9BACT|nr:IS481 family transposase [Geothermobacter ehrlichii]TYO97164.1 transposase InsO family protein [Geothermobacter ehrlichii]
MDPKVRMRLRWVELYFSSGNAGFVCRRCGISRPTLRKWVTRFKEKGLEGLQDESRRPRNFPTTKVTKEIEGWILDLRRTRNLGARRIQGELIRLHNLKLSLATIHKVLTRNQAKPLLRPKRIKPFKRYSRPVPGDRVQMDTMKIAPGIYQYTAVDDCSRWRVLGVYKRRTAKNTLDFLERVCEEMPFPIQRIQTDRGTEFFAYKVQERLKDWGIKFRPIRPASPHLNGKVERSQKTDLFEFWANVDMNDPELGLRIEEWQYHYNWHRPHGALNGKSPIDLVCELHKETPLTGEVCQAYDPSQEDIRDQNYKADLEMQRLKRSL